MSLTKQRYCAILASGVFASLLPPELARLHTEVGQYLRSHSGGLNATELFDLYELQFYLALLTNHDVEAKSYLDRICDQFSGKSSQKIMILRLMYHEACGDMNSAVKALGDSADELRASRRLATFSRRKADGTPNVAEYVQNLNYYLNLQPGDAMAWAELGDQYHNLGHYDKAVFCWKEVLLQQPNAYNVFCKVGLNYYYQYLQEYPEVPDKKDKQLAAMELLGMARDAFLRAAEISPSYVRSWVGVYVVSGNGLLDRLASNKTLSAQKAVAEFVSETSKLRKLSILRVMKLEKLQSEKEFEDFLAGAF